MKLPYVEERIGSGLGTGSGSGSKFMKHETREHDLSRMENGVNLQCVCLCACMRVGTSVFMYMCVYCRSCLFGFLQFELLDVNVIVLFRLRYLSMNVVCI